MTIVSTIHIVLFYRITLTRYIYVHTVDTIVFNFIFNHYII